MFKLVSVVLLSSIYIASPTKEANMLPEEYIIEQLDESGQELFSDEEFKTEFFNICKENEAEPELIISMIKSESTYNPEADNGTCVGLMQINPKWHKDRMERLGVTDLSDPIQNVKVGVDYLMELRSTRTTEYALMVYNMGYKNAKEHFKTKGYSYYATSIVAYANELKPEMD